MSDEFFYNLTPDTVLGAIEQSGFLPTGHCLTLNSYENRVYDCRLDDGSHVIAKFYRPGRWSREQILEEHRFLFDLQEDEIPVCAPLRFDDGESVQETAGIWFALWPRTGGRARDEFSDADLQTLGRMLARIHNVGAVTPCRHRISLTGETYGLQPLSYLEANGFLPGHCAVRYREAVQEITGIYEELRAGVPEIRIHGDCHHGNLLLGNQGWFFLDFDDFLTGPAVQDVWMLVPARDTEGLRRRSVFLDAYRQFRDFDDAWLRLIEPLRALRFIRYAAWIARRWDDPAFPAAFPHFGTQQYWEDQTADLEEQLDYCRRARSGNASGPAPDNEEEEPELTNKDFFWDWED